MITIEYRKYNFKFKEVDTKSYIFDEIRKKYILLTPEEWVRQNILHHLIYDLGYNKNRIAVEKEFEVNFQKKRFDILVYKEDLSVFMLIECKAPEIPINEKTAKQIFNYNVYFNANFIMLSNGNDTFCLDDNKNWIHKLPNYNS